MKVALVAGSFPPGGGGAERQLLRVLAELRSRDWEVVVVARWLGDSPRAYVLDGVQVVRVGSADVTRRNAVMFTVEAARQVAGEHPDVAIGLQAGSSPAAAALATVFGWRRIPFVLRLTGNDIDGNQLAVRGRTRGSRLVTGAVLRSAAAIVAPAHHLLQGAGPFQARVDQIGRVIPNGAPEPVERQGEAPPSKVLWVGRAVGVKNYPEFVELARRCPDLRFLSVGPGPELSDGVSNLDARGWLADARPSFADAAVLVSTSRSEGSPNVVVEALVSGIPVVAYDCVGVREATEGITHGVRIVPQGDVDALAAAVRDALADTRGVEGRTPSISEASDLWGDLLERVARR